MAQRRNLIQEIADEEGVMKMAANDPINVGTIVYTFQNAYGVKGFAEGKVVEVLPNDKFKVEDQEGMYRGETIDRSRSMLWKKANGQAQPAAPPDDVEMAMGGRHRRRKTRARKTKRRKTLRRK